MQLLRFNLHEIISEYSDVIENPTSSNHNIKNHPSNIFD